MEYRSEQDEKSNRKRIPPFHSSFYWGDNDKSLYLLIHPPLSGCSFYPEQGQPDILLMKKFANPRIFFSAEKKYFHDFLDKSEMNLLN
jgi:hypothetical protein